MQLTSELYLTKKFVENKEWQEFIEIISNYNGIFNKWSLIIIINKNQIRYFIKTKYSLPATINNCNSFLLKKTNTVILPTTSYFFPFFININSSLVDIINLCQIKEKGKLIFLEIKFRKLYHNKILSSINLYLKKKDILKRYRIIFGIPSSILSIDFEGNKRYMYKSAPKYLDISKVIHLLNHDISNAILKIDTFPYLQGNFYLNQNNYSFDKHSIIFGASGCGKSKFISQLIHNINKVPNLKMKYKIVVIDPHAALENDIGGIGKVIDFKTQLDSIDLFINKIDDVIASTELLLELFKTLIADLYNSKLERVLRHSIYLLLTNESFNFSNLRKVILDLEYRNDLIRKLKNQLPSSVIDFFLSDFNDLKTKSYGQAISPIISFIDEMEMVPVFNDQNNMNNLKDTIHDNFLTLFSLDRIKLGDKVTKTISGLIMQQMLTLIQSYSIDKHIIFVIDEVSVIENPIIARFLSEARKYNLSLILAGQYFNQISDNLKNAIFANVVNYYIFRVSRIDANILVDNFNMKIPLEDTKEKKIKLLTELNNRECIVRINSNGILLPAFKATTLNFKSIPRIKKIIEDNNNQNQIADKTNKKKFSIDSNINLKDILISTSSSRKVVK